MARRGMLPADSHTIVRHHPGDDATVDKPTIDQLLIRAALEPGLCRRVLESPDQVFAEFDLTADEQEILRHPDHRLLPLLGAALSRQMSASGPVGKSAAVAAEDAEIEAPAAPGVVFRGLPDTAMVLTLVPCALREEGEFKGITYVMWASPLPQGTDPAALPPPAGTVFPGEPLAPLHATIRITALQSRDAEGNPRLSICGSFHPSPEACLPPPPESAGDVDVSPYRSPIHSEPVQTAVAAVRRASSEEKYDRLVDLLHALHQGGVR